MIQDIGEFGLIDRIRRATKTSGRVIKGIGDDAAVLRIGKKKILFKTDMIIEDRHFRLTEAPLPFWPHRGRSPQATAQKGGGEATPFEIGRKALAVNVSDIAAMGGTPTEAVVALGLPADLSVDFIDELYRGFRFVAKKFGIDLVGGDTNATDKLILSVALLGEAPLGRVSTRSGAKPGDVVFVTGSLGGSYASRKHLNFTPRLKEAQFLLKNFDVHAMMDISDGLASDIRRICEESRTGARLAESAVPLSAYAANAEAALTDGEDFELLFALPPRAAAKLSLMRLPKGLAPFGPVGKIVPKKLGIKLVKADGTLMPLSEKGYDHFRRGR